MRERCDSLHDDLYYEALSNLAQLCGNNAVQHKDLEDLLTTLYAMYGEVVLSMIVAYKEVCRDFGDLRKLMGIIHEVIEEVGVPASFDLPIFAKMSQHFSLFKLRKAMPVFLTKGPEHYEKLLHFIDSVGLISDEDFAIFADLMRMTGYEECRHLERLMKHFDSVDCTDTSFIRSSADIMRIGGVLPAEHEEQRRVLRQSCMEIASLFSSLWQKNLHDKPRIVAIKEKLVRMMHSGDLEAAKDYLRDPSKY